MSDNHLNIANIQKISQKILTICENPNTALQAIHLILQYGGASELAWRIVYQRVMADNDVDGAYYLANFAQKIDDLPFDGLPLIELILTKGDDNLQQALLDKLPKATKEHLTTLGLLT